MDFEGQKLVRCSTFYSRDNEGQWLLVLCKCRVVIALDYVEVSNLSMSFFVEKCAFLAQFVTVTSYLITGSAPFHIVWQTKGNAFLFGRK